MRKEPSWHKAQVLAAVTLLALVLPASGDGVAARSEPVRPFEALAQMNAQESQERVPAPDAPGPYNVGTTTFPAIMTGGRVTLVQVFYPTLDEGDCDRKYTIQSPPGPYQVTSPSCAVENATVAPGPFAWVVYDHGGGGPGGDFQRVVQSPLHELQATHGFPTFVALHSGDAAVRVRDLSALIDLALARSATPGDPFFGSLDPERIGIAGLSAGGGAAVGIAGGWAARGIAADPRIKAMVLYEPGQVTTLADASTISFPYLIMGGTQFAFAATIPAFLDATVDASPRIHVRSPDAVHVNYNTSLCPFTEETRETALLADPSLPEPLTNPIAGNPAAIAAYNNWRFGQTQFPILGPGFGGARNVCNRIGVDSVRSLDANPEDGFTDQPPFMASDAFTLAPAIPAEVMVPVVKLYTVAFWKTFLEGDRRYMPYLTPGYATVHTLPAEVTIRD
jgi:dienelactone hydrolase